MTSFTQNAMIPCSAVLTDNNKMLANLDHHVM